MRQFFKFVLATSCFQACTVIGLPESDLILAQTVIFLATSVKSNAAYLAIRAAQAEVKANGVYPVPVTLRNAPTRLLKQLGYGKEYAYSHNGEGNFEEQEFLPDALSGTRFYAPGQNASEAKIQERLRGWWGDKYGY